jgi:hypothetical protein
MKTFKYGVLMVAILSGAFFLSTASAQSEGEQYLGTPETCIDTPRIKETLVLDNQTILFRMLSGELYLNRLVVPCTGLKIAGAFGYETSIAKLCKQDSVSVIEPSNAPSATCMLGDFLPFKFEGTYNEAVKLLRDGLLAELSKEGAFKDLYPSNE